MASRINVINSALRRIGGSRITDPEEDSKNANVARDIYDDILEDLLRSHAWNFATRRQQLAELANTPAFEFERAFALPSDWIRTISVHPNADGSQSVIEYKEEEQDDQGVILASVEEIYLRYVALVTDVNRWPKDFKNAMIFTLARDMAVPIASSNELADRMDRFATRALGRARSTDAMGGTPERRPRGTWVTRRGYVRPRVGEPDPGTV